MAECGLCCPLKTHDTAWDPSSVKVSLNIALDGCIVPTTAGGARVDYAHLVVLDNFLDEPTRAGLLEALTAPGWQGASPPQPKWERRTADAAERPPTWGLQSSVLAGLADGDLPAKLEVQSRLCKLYPDMLIAHMPSEHIQLRQPPPEGAASAPSYQPQQQQQQQQQQQAQTSSLQHNLQQERLDGVDCSRLLANAAVYGDNFSWHVDADPQDFPQPSRWTQQYGLYCNREPGKPLLVSLLVYLDKEWPRENDAETLFLDNQTDTGVFVRPKPYRAVLMDQDVAHRLSTPSASAGRPRYSLVWKLVMLPKAPVQRGSITSGAGIARKEWGQPVYFGSAAHVVRVAKTTAAAAAAAAAAIETFDHFE